MDFHLNHAKNMKEIKSPQHDIIIKFKEQQEVKI